MKNLSKSEFELLVENQQGNRKELAFLNLKEVVKITPDDLEIETKEILVGIIYSLEDCYLTIIDTYEEDYPFFYSEEIDEA